jgi:hypothetical protein
MSSICNLRAIAIAAKCATVAAALLWMLTVALIWSPASDRALSVSSRAASCSTLSALMLWLARWFGGRIIAYAADARATRRRS